MIDLSTNMMKTFRFRNWLPEVFKKDGNQLLVLQCFVDDERYFYLRLPLCTYDATDADVARIIHQAAVKYKTGNDEKPLEYEATIAVSKEEVKSVLEDLDDAAQRMGNANGTFFDIVKEQGWTYNIQTFRKGNSRIMLHLQLDEQVSETIHIGTSIYPYDTKDLYEQLKNELMKERQIWLGKVQKIEDAQERERKMKSLRVLMDREDELVQQLEKAAEDEMLN